jgi:hypothetical protein
MKKPGTKVFDNLLFCVLSLLLISQYFIFAQQPGSEIPEALTELISGESSDFHGVASSLKETDLPYALSMVKLLKFKALHHEIPVNIDAINEFETSIKSRIEHATAVSFVRNESCLKRVEKQEIEIEGQKLTIPEYFVSEMGLAITKLIPTGEAGTIFPDIQANFFSDSPITEYRLSIDGKAVSNNKISQFDDGEELGLIFRPDLNAEGAFSIGTHTAEISITNESGEQTTRQWSFTVGVEDVSTPSLPEDTKIVKEFQIDPQKILPSAKNAGNLTIIVYQNSNGRRYTEYKLVTNTGLTLKSRNLAFIARKMNSMKGSRAEFNLFPQIAYAFIGNSINFHYEWTGDGQVVSEVWHITTGNQIYNRPSIIFQGFTAAKCEIIVERTLSDPNRTYDYTYSDEKYIRDLSVTSKILSARQFLIASEKPHGFDLRGKVDLESHSIALLEGAEIVLAGNGETSGVLKIDKLRWKIVESEGQPKIENPIATETSIIFADYGFAEVVFDIDMTYSQSGMTLKSSFKPQQSALFAFYPVEGDVELAKYHSGQLTGTKRLLTIKRFEFKIKNQIRVLESESDCELKPPIELCKSSIWPAKCPFGFIAILLNLIHFTEHPCSVTPVL